MRILKNKYFYAIVIVLGFLVSCSSGNEPIGGLDIDVAEHETVVMKLLVNASNISSSPLAESTAAKVDPVKMMSLPEDDGEKMKTLRIIVVRPNGVVEHNKYFDLSQPNTTFSTELEVRKSETKKIYLFANEKTTKANGKKIIDFDFNSIAPNYNFPADALKNLLMETNLNNEVLPSPVPMTDCHTVAAPDHDFSVDLSITRAVVKFTLKIKNETPNPISINDIEIYKLANKSYVLPRVTEYSAGNGIINFIVPTIGNNNYYMFTYKQDGEFVIPGKQTAGSKNVLDIRKIYLLEGKYTDSVDARNYSISLTINGIKQTQYFPNLKQLPRNTHVVVIITLTDVSLNWEAEVIPFTSVDLNPSFGL